VIGNGECETVVVAGSGKYGSESEDGKPTECYLDWLWGIAVDEKTHSCFVSEFGSSRIRQITFIDE
jgi:hypothetical protein